jgi:lipopolysaccharide/colanic/teichoic acid biosynthesis glycosyltransferase
MFSKQFAKRILDLSVAAILSVVLAPLLALIAIAVKFSSPGPVIFRQARLGLHGKPFGMLKFRSMVQNAEFAGTGLFNYQNDPRVTRVGAILRRTGFDELPQLFNILRGEMSLVGPRPAVTYELGDPTALDAELTKRLTVPQGVTGYAQIHGRNRLSRDEKTKHDLAYVDDFNRYGVWIDIKVIAKTVLPVIRMEGSYELPENADADKSIMQGRRKN